MAVFLPGERTAWYTARWLTYEQALADAERQARHTAGTIVNDFDSPDRDRRQPRAR